MGQRPGAAAGQPIDPVVRPGHRFAVDFGTLPDGSPISVTIDAIASIIGTPAQRQLTFRGWTSSTPFSTVSFSTRAQYLILDNVTRAEAQPVPAPAPLALTGLALLAFAARRRSGH